MLYYYSLTSLTMLDMNNSFIVRGVPVSWGSNTPKLNHHWHPCLRRLDLTTLSKTTGKVYVVDDIGVGETTGSSCKFQLCHSYYGPLDEQGPRGLFYYNICFD
jgi:hypothetical protein